MNLDHSVDEIEVTIEDLFIEHYEPPVPAKASSPLKTIAKRKIPHPTSLLGIALLGGLIVGAGFLGYRRLFA
jgi:hypothetical protein